MALKTGDTGHRPAAAAMQSILAWLAVAALLAMAWLEKKNINGLMVVVSVVVLIAIAVVVTLVCLLVAMLSGAADLTTLARHADTFAAMR